MAGTERLVLLRRDLSEQPLSHDLVVVRHRLAAQQLPLALIQVTALLAQRLLRSTRNPSHTREKLLYRYDHYSTNAR